MVRHRITGTLGNQTESHYVGLERGNTKFIWVLRSLHVELKESWMLKFYLSSNSYNTLLVVYMHPLTAGEQIGLREQNVLLND